MRYRAFLSYSHADARWARWLLRRLESYRIPSRLVGTAGRDGPIPASLGAVFRDRDELPSAGDLSSTIRGALEQSAALVVICSPSAAQSPWVNAEIEAFRKCGRGEHIHCLVVGGDPTGRDPANSCFPPALLLPDGPGLPPHEPLAADARTEGDGRERAFLKLVAGLLGVGYDTLAQREAQRRHRRLAAVTVASLAGMAVALALAASAYVARNDAQRRQAQAEDILGFMLGDLRKKLATVGRLDLMRTVDDKATVYFATLDPRDLSDRALEEQARSLTGIGQVRLDEGNHAAAMEAFREAHSRSTALYARQPQNGQRLFDLSQAQFWIGFVAWQQGNFAEADRWLRKYRDSAIALAARDRNNFDWQKEVAYSYQNLAVLDESLGRYAEAEKAMLAQRSLYRDWTRQRPADLDLRFEAANVDSWLGSLALQLGRLSEAEQYFVLQDDAMRRNVVDDPGNANWKAVRVDALLLLADVQAQRGRLDQARSNVESAVKIASALAASDPQNNPWQISLGRCRWWQAQLDSAQPERAATRAAQAEALLAAAYRAAPRNESALVWLVKARDLRARQALVRGDQATAQAQLARALVLIEPAWAKNHSEMLRVRLAKTRVLQGEVARRAGRLADANAAFGQARDLLLEQDAGRPMPFPRLDPLVRALRFLGQDEAASSHRRQLEAAGYVPLVPWPAAEAASKPGTIVTSGSQRRVATRVPRPGLGHQAAGANRHAYSLSGYP